MLQLKQWTLQENDVIVTKCPVCDSPIRFIHVAPFDCEKCGAELLDYYDIFDDVNARIEYHLTGDPYNGC